MQHLFLSKRRKSDGLDIVIGVHRYTDGVSISLLRERNRETDLPSSVDLALDVYAIEWIEKSGSLLFLSSTLSLTPISLIIYVKV